ncbi:MAG: hypothetical protein ACI3XQ_04780 [Eubacteriales bacterium]
MKKILFVMALVLMLSVAFVSCKSSKTSEETTGGSTSESVSSQTEAPDTDAPKNTESGDETGGGEETTGVADVFTFEDEESAGFGKWIPME